MGIWCKYIITGTALLFVFGCSQLVDNPPDTSVEKCNACHELPPSDSLHNIHLGNPEQEIACIHCHGSYSSDEGWSNDSHHRNGIVDTVSEQCDRCHNYQDCNSCHDSPPKDPEFIGYGSDPELTAHLHSIHDKLGYSCDSCHGGYDKDRKKFSMQLHENGAVDLVFRIKSAESSHPVFRNDSCFNVYCHGSDLPGGKSAVGMEEVIPSSSVSTPGATKCDFCHPLEPLRKESPTHSIEAHKYDFMNCAVCHDGFSADERTSNEDIHRNGKLDFVSPPPVPDSCGICHNSELP